MIIKEGQQPQEGPNRITRREFILTTLGIFGAGAVAGTAAGTILGANATDRGWRKSLQGLERGFNEQQRKLEELYMSTSTDTLRYGAGTIVAGRELAENGSFNRTEWDRATEKQTVPGWTPLPDNDDARTYASAGRQSPSPRYIAIRNDSKAPETENKQFWLSNPIAIDPNKRYVAAFDITCFKDNFINPDGIDPTLHFRFLDQNGEMIKTERAYLQWLATGAYEPWRRIIAKIGEEGRGVSAPIPQGTRSMQLLLGAVGNKDARFITHETRFTDISVRELGTIPTPPKDTLGRPV